VVEVGTEFGVDELLNEDMRRGRLASLLCYLGALTVDGKTADGNTLLTIPNLAMRNLYAERIIELCDFVEENFMFIYDNRDYPQFKELTLKSLFLSLLYHNNLYTIKNCHGKGEEEAEIDRQRSSG